MPNGLALAVLLLVIMLFLANILSLLIYFFTPFYSTPYKTAKKIVDLFKLKETDTFADLGSGDGRMVFLTYKKYKCKSVGYEISPVLLMFFKLKKLFLYPFNKNIQLREQSFFNTDLSKYNVIYCCLPKDILDILEKRFSQQLLKGTQVFTYRGKLTNKKGKRLIIEDKEVYQYTF